MKNYYAFVATGLVKHPGRREFWKLQKAGLAEMGLRLSAAKTLRAGVLKGLQLLLKPGLAVKKTFAVRRESGEVEAQYY